MALLVLCDAKYRNSSWCDTKLRGICDEAVRRRIQPEIYTDIAQFETAAAKLDADSSVIVLFDSLNYLKNVCTMLRRYKIHPIISANYIAAELPVSYSMVGSDADGAMRTMVDYLHMCGKRRVALVGANSNSCNDTARVHMLKKHIVPDDCRIFYVKDDMQECYREFAAVQNDFDAVICTNDHIAICLTEYLKNYERDGEKLFVISHTDTVMARLYSDGITSMSVNFYNCGRAAVESHFNRIKYGWANSKVLLPAKLQIRGSTDFIPYSEEKIISPDEPLLPEPSPKRSRPSAGNLSRLERVLASSDLANLKLMYCMICDYSYDKMSEFCFVSADTAKYRVRKIKQMLDTAKKSDAAEIIREYIKKESLLALISDIEEKNNSIIL
ncbi:MAG: LacI family DNA-binding transcriptional regulator [Clostridia bacterium]|nr:LacI family DNA-binding transcriptional regulator [Clostridia bacterium]